MVLPSKEGIWAGIERSFEPVEVDRLGKSAVVARLGHFQSEFAGALGRLDEPIAVARFLQFRKEKVQLDKADVLDFIRALIDELMR